MSSSVLQVKICGLTSAQEAEASAAFGASAIGCVFYPRSPRFVTDEQAREISLALPPGVAAVGVFVNEDYDAIMRRVEYCRLRGAQLHGQEPPDLVKRLRAAEVTVIKALYVNGTPSVGESASYPEASAFLVEAKGGSLPGGNALSWEWGAVREKAFEGSPLVLAGGLHAGNVAEAVAAASPDAVDVSSGVEASPGRKDLSKVREFLEAVRKIEIRRPPRAVFF